MRHNIGHSNMYFAIRLNEKNLTSQESVSSLPAQMVIPEYTVQVGLSMMCFYMHYARQYFCVDSGKYFWPNA